MGVGARSLQECLKLQLEKKDINRPEVNHALTIIKNYFNEFSHKHYKKLQEKLGDKITICDEFDEIQRENFYSVSINLGTGFAGNYNCLLYTSPSPRDS